MKNNSYDLDAAYEASRYNREALAKSKRCGCYYCLEIYSPSEIIEWCQEEEDGEEVTAICPYCSVDAVLAEASGFSLTKEFFTAMEKKWFEYIVGKLPDITHYMIGDYYSWVFLTFLGNLKRRTSGMIKSSNFVMMWNETCMRIIVLDTKK